MSADHPSSSDSEVLFFEQQRFSSTWLWLNMLVVAVVAGVAIYSNYQNRLAQLTSHQPSLCGRVPASAPDLKPMLIGIGITALAVGIILVFSFFSTLHTRVSRDGLTLQFKPFHFTPRQIDLTHVYSVEPIIYSPLGDYGGWGIRYRLKGKGKAYNVSGKRGALITYSDGHTLLIGSQRADELAAAISQIIKK